MIAENLVAKNLNFHRVNLWNSLGDATGEELGAVLHSKQFCNRSATANNAYRSAARVFEMCVKWNSERVVNCGEQIQGRDRPFLNSSAPLFTRTNDATAPNTASCKQDAEAICPVIAACVSIHSRCAAEFTNAVDDNFVQHAS